MRDHKPPKSNIWVVIPCFNESVTIKEIVLAVHQVIPDIIVVNDASTDQTSSLLTKLPVTSLTNPQNLGYVESVQIGLNYAFSHGADYVITFDADGQHLASDLSKFLSIIHELHPEIVFGMRSFKNRFVEKLFSLYAKHYLGISDPFCGFKAYSRGFFKRIGGRLEDHYTIGLESVFRELLKSHLKPTEVSLTTARRRDDSRFAGRLKGNILELCAAANLIWNSSVSR